MSVSEFVDSNIFVYYHDRSAGAKRSAALSLIDRLWGSGSGCLSVQVLQEFYAVGTGKLGLPRGEAVAQLRRLSTWRVHAPVAADVLDAAERQARARISFWDSMIVQSARQLGCEILWTEDLNTGQQIDGVEIRNPFAA